MSKATKRKHVTKELRQDVFSVPTGEQTIVRMVDSRGNNLHEIAEPTGERYLVSMPVKFRRNVWIKRGDFVLVEPIAEGDKVKAEIIKILTKDHIKFYKSQNCWPKQFIDNASEEPKIAKNGDEKESSEEDEEDGDLFVNTNRQPKNFQGSQARSTSSESTESD